MLPTRGRNAATTTESGELHAVLSQMLWSERSRESLFRPKGTQLSRTTMGKLVFVAKASTLPELSTGSGGAITCHFITLGFVWTH